MFLPNERIGQEVQFLEMNAFQICLSKLFFLIIFNRLFFSGIWDNKKMQKSAFDIYKDSATRSSTNIRTVYSNGG